MKKSVVGMCVAGGIALAVVNLFAQAPVKSAAKASTNEWELPASRLTNRIDLVPGPDDGKIALLVGNLLQRSHYLSRRQPFDEEVSAKFMDQFLDALDPLHLVLLQSDVNDFERFRRTLNSLTMIKADSSPAETVFNRYMQRLDQQIDYVSGLLKTETFTFTNDERYVANRRTLPRPKDLTEAKSLWRDRLRYEYLQEKLNQKTPEEIVKIITRRYTRIQRYLREYDSGDVLQIYLTALTHVYDPHSDYMRPSQMESFSIDMKNSLCGIGARLQWEDGYCKIQELLAGGPAAKSNKLKPNDRISAVAQGNQEPVDVVDMKLDKAVELIRGPKGTEVRLTIIPADAADPSIRRTVVLIRDEIKLEERDAKAKIIEMPQNNNLRLGILDLPSFYGEIPTTSKTDGLKSSSQDVARLLKKMKEEKVRGVILDLRNNGGGSLPEAISLTGLFIKDGPVVQVKDWDGTVLVERDNDSSVLYDGPLVVLTSRFSASASEILAGALQDYDRAVIVGDKATHGKGTVQTLVSLDQYTQKFFQMTNNPGNLKLTIRKFYRATGSSTQRKGVIPDIILPSANNYAEVGEEVQPYALGWDTIDPAKFEKSSQVQPYLAELQRRSTNRMAADKDFLFLRTEVERAKNILEDKTVSMNEARRRQEKQEAEARQKARKKELRERPDSALKVYDLALKQVDLPGLPPPVSKTNVLAMSFTFTNAAGVLVSKTNVLAAAEAKKTVADPDDPEATTDEDETPELDLGMIEAERILVDLISLTDNAPAIAETTRFIR